VTTERTDGVATVTLRSEHNRNALSAALLTQLDHELRAAVRDHDVRVVVLTGSGAAFCAGADLKEQTSGITPLVSLASVLELLWHSSTPVVCRLNGLARGGGVGLAAAADLVIAPDTCTFAFSEVRLGVAPAMIAVPVLRRIPPPVALQLFLTGETFDARRAVEIGLVNVVTAPDELDDTVRQYVDMLLAGGPTALAITKQLCRDVPSLSVSEGLREMEALSTRTFASAEAQEGMRAFREKRPPSWLPPH
jgi:methylglutaconyl-CoA hydratase